MYRHELVVDVLSESVGSLFLLAIQRSEIEFVNRAAVIWSYPLQPVGSGRIF